MAHIRMHARPTWLALLVTALAFLVYDTFADDWTHGRATYYDDNQQGSCKFYADIPEWYGAWPDTLEGFQTSCGSCWEVSCVNSNFSDGFGAFMERSSACYDENKSVVIKIVDSCPCVHQNFCSNQRHNGLRPEDLAEQVSSHAGHLTSLSTKLPFSQYTDCFECRWCCGDMKHLDLGRKTMEELADLKWGVIGLKWRQASCDNLGPRCISDSSNQPADDGNTEKNTDQSTDSTHPNADLWSSNEDNNTKDGDDNNEGSSDSNQQADRNDGRQDDPGYTVSKQGGTTTITYWPKTDSWKSWNPPKKQESFGALLSKLQLANPAYYKSKLTSAVITSLMTGVPVVADSAFLSAYSMLGLSTVFHQSAGQSELDVMFSIAAMPVAEIQKTRLAVQRLRHKMNARAVNLILGWMLDRGLVPDADSGVSNIL